MELREVIGRRRSIRFLRPYRPVEPEKIQRMLEAARLASHWGNVGSIRAVVVFRDSAPKEVLDAITAPIAGYQIRLAPVVLIWYLDTDAVDRQSDRLRELLKAGALGFGEGKEKALETQLIPIFDSIRDKLKDPGLGEVDGGQAIAQATLMAFEQGLGTCCLGSPNIDKIRAALGMPETCRILLIQTVGYPAESPEAGGQRPRQPFEQLFHMNRYGNPFPRSAEVVAELERDRMIQAPAPAPWREAELEWLKNALGVKGHGLL
jgi:nitroreductase